MWSDLCQTHGYWALALGSLLGGGTMLLLAGFAAHRGWRLRALLLAGL